MAENTLGRNIKFQIYNSDGTPFENLVLHKSTVESVVMSLGDKITGDVYYKNNHLEVTMREYIVYNDVKYTIVNPPTILREGLVKDNGDLKGMTKYSFEFYHPMYQLGNFPFSDVAVSSGQQRYLSENKKFSWIGYPDDYIAKLNKNLDGTEWVVEKTNRFPVLKDSQLSEVLAFDNNTVAEALKKFYETWEVPYVVSDVSPNESYYAQGKRFKVSFGLPSQEIYASESDRQLDRPFVFKMGQGVGLKNNSRTPSNNKIITRIAGYGSEDNIPYGYPQIPYEGIDVPYPLYDGIVGGRVVKLIKHPFTRTHLMPSIYRQTVKQKIYNQNVELKDYYDATGAPYTNLINPSAPCYEIHEFEDIKPEFGEEYIIDAQPINDSDKSVADEWDDTIDSDGNYNQGYFQITLPILSFDLYACAAITQEMQINMRGGACIGCTFTVQVDWDNYKANFYNQDGEFDPEGERRDYEKYPDSRQRSITVIVQKEYSTFGTIMPNVFQQPKNGDQFVFLGISMPSSYIEQAEQRLDDEMRSYMLENNTYHYEYPLKFDEYFLATHQYILEQLKPNSIVRFDFAGQELELFVKQTTIKYGESQLPQYNITLTDNIEIVLNQIGQVADDVEKLSSLVAILRQSYGRNVWVELSKKLSKVSDDTAQGFIRFMKGLQVGEDFVSGLLGEGGVFRKDADGTTYLEADKMYVRMKAYFDTVEIRKFLHSGGNRIASVAGAKCVRVVPFAIYNGSEVALSDDYRYHWTTVDPDTGEEIQHQSAQYSDNPEATNHVEYYRCYFRGSDGDDAVTNDFIIGDQAYCHITNGDTQALQQHQYWRLVLNKSNYTDADGMHYIDLSNHTEDTLVIEGVEYKHAGFQTGSDVPSAQDDIVQLGNIADKTRQGAIIEYVSGEDAPSYQIYQGIDDFNLEGKNYVGIGYNSHTGRAYMNVYGDAYIGDKAQDGGYMEYDSNTHTLNIMGHLRVGSTLEDGRDINALGTKRGNLLRNTGFTGDYKSEPITAQTPVNPSTEIFSDPLAHWVAEQVTVIGSEESVSGMAAQIGSLQQEIDGGLTIGEWYILSFRARGSVVNYSIGGVSGSISLTPVVTRYDIPLLCGQDTPLRLEGKATVMELQLMAGSLPTEWQKSYRDNDRTMAEYHALKYLRDAITGANTDIIGGLILSQILKVGNYRNGVMMEETGGISGARNDDNSPFLWGGGSMEQAIYTIMKYASDPSQAVTDTDLSNMAKFVVTHGGRAILTDIILRGWIYAQGGEINGNLNVVGGSINAKDASSRSMVQVNGMSRSVSESEDVTIIDSRGFYIKRGNNGFRLTTNGLERWNPKAVVRIIDRHFTTEGAWQPFYSTRFVRNVEINNGGWYELNEYDDFVIVKVVNSGSETPWIKLPSSNISSGKVITIKATGTTINVTTRQSSTEADSEANKLILYGNGNAKVSYKDLNDSHRAELVYDGQYWWWNYMDV